MQTKSPLMTSLEASVLLGAFTDASKPGTGIVVTPSLAGTKNFVMFKPSPGSELAELGLDDMKIVSDETSPETKGRVTQTRIYASPTDKKSTKTFLKYQVVSQSELIVDGVPQRSAQIHYSAYIYRIKGEFDLTYHKTFHCSVDQ